MTTDWDTLPYQQWAPTCATLHLWLQIVGKYRLSHAPWVNHSWHATFYVTPRGLTTGPVPDHGRTIAATFDFIDHCLVAKADDGARSTMPLEPMSVADFLAQSRKTIESVGGTVDINTLPCELPDAVPFDLDREQREYDADAARRYHRVLLRIAPVFGQFRSAFIGKVSPVHLFWGAMDLAVTRFSGRRAPLHPGGIPGVSDAIMQEAYSHEVSSAGFWPGGMGVDEPMFYSYAYPAPSGFSDWPVEPAGAYFHEELGEFVLPYANVQQCDDPADCLTRFLTSTYDAAAELGRWPRADLEGPPGRPGRPRPIAERGGPDASSRRP